MHHTMMRALQTDDIGDDGIMETRIKATGQMSERDKLRAQLEEMRVEYEL